MDPINDISVSKEEIEKFIDKLACEIVKRHMEVPAIVILESIKPLSFVGSQAMVFFNPIIGLLGEVKGYAKFQKILENRENLEKLIIAIEQKE